MGTGATLPMIGGILGHTQAQTTQRYAHLMDDPMRLVSDTTAEVIDGWLSSDEDGAL